MNQRKKKRAAKTRTIQLRNEETETRLSEQDKNYEIRSNQIKKNSLYYISYGLNILHWVPFHGTSSYRLHWT